MSLFDMSQFSGSRQLVEDPVELKFSFGIDAKVGNKFIAEAQRLGASPKEDRRVSVRLDTDKLHLRSAGRSLQLAHDGTLTLKAVSAPQFQNAVSQAVKELGHNHLPPPVIRSKITDKYLCKPGRRHVEIDELPDTPTNIFSLSVRELVSGVAHTFNHAAPLGEEGARLKSQMLFDTASKTVTLYVGQGSIDFKSEWPALRPESEAIPVLCRLDTCSFRKPSRYWPIEGILAETVSGRSSPSEYLGRPISVVKFGLDRDSSPPGLTNKQVISAMLKAASAFCLYAEDAPDKPVLPVSKMATALGRFASRTAG